MHLLFVHCQIFDFKDWKINKSLMVYASVRGDTPRALASDLSPVETQNLTITCLLPQYEGSLTVWALYAYFSDSQNAAFELLVRYI